MSMTAVISIIVTAAVVAAVALWMRLKWFLYCGGIRRDIPVTPRRFIESLYSLLLFIFLVYGVALPLIAALYLTVWNRDRRLYILHIFLRWSSQLILRLLPGIDYTYNNATGEQFKDPAVIISNHQGHLDLMCIMMMTPRLVVLTNNWVWRNPLYGWLIRLAEFYPVANGLDYNIPKLKSLIDRGYSVVVFPEGTRSPECNILRFHTGAFYLAEKLGVDILPVILHGVGHCIPKKDFMLRPGHMYLEVMPRVKVKSDGTELYMRNLTKRVRAIYVDKLDRLRKERETATYYARYIFFKYTYTGIRRRVSRLLCANNNYTDTVDTEFHEGTTIAVTDTSAGVLSWLLALVHPNVKVYAAISNDRDYVIASGTPSHPSNLIFFHGSKIDVATDYEIIMRGDGSVESVTKCINDNE